MKERIRDRGPCLLGILACLIAVVCAVPVYAQAGDNETATGDASSAVEQMADDLKEEVSGWFGEWAKYEILPGTAWWQVISAFVLLLAGLVLKKISDYLLEQRVVPLLEKTRFSADSLIVKAAAAPVGYVLLLTGVSAAIGMLTLPTDPNVRGFAFAAIKVLFAANLLWFLFRLVDVLVEYLSGLAQRTESKLDDQLVPLIRKALKVTIGVICSVWVVQLLGYNVGSLIAGLGIGGLAVALALQDSLANFFGSIFIFLDRPFAVGDLVKIGDVEGTVEEIGFRSTRIRTFPKTLVAMPNKTVANATVDNWTKRPVRRVLQTVGVTYETTADEMEKAVAAIHGILENDPGVDQEFIVVRFDEFGDSSLNILVYYFTKDTDFAPHLETKERVNLAVMRALETLGLSIAFPTRTVYFEGDVAKTMAGLQKKRGGAKDRQ